MKSKYLYLIPLMLVEVILQLIFFWLTKEVPCYWVVYAFGTVMSLAHIVVVFATGIIYGIRKSAATISAGSVCQIFLVGVCVVLLLSEASIRNAVFALLITSILYVVIITLLILSIEKKSSLYDYTNENPFGDYSDMDMDMNTEHPVYKPQTPPVVVRENSGIRHLTPDVLITDIPTNNAVTPPPLPVRRYSV